MVSVFSKGQHGPRARVMQSCGSAERRLCPLRQLNAAGAPVPAWPVLAPQATLLRHLSLPLGPAHHLIPLHRAPPPLRPAPTGVSSTTPTSRQVGAAGQATRKAGHRAYVAGCRQGQLLRLTMPGVQIPPNPLCCLLWVCVARSVADRQTRKKQAAAPSINSSTLHLLSFPCHCRTTFCLPAPWPSLFSLLPCTRCLST